MSRISLFALIVAFASPAFSQVVYEPVQYQYGTTEKFYYGGSDWRVIERAMTPRTLLEGEVERVYVDSIPTHNARLFGYTATDARNQANANVPRYFRKADLPLLVVPAADSGWVVPAQARVVNPNARIIVSKHGLAPLISGPRPVFIIPKKALDQPTNPHLKIALAAIRFALG